MDGVNCRAIDIAGIKGRPGPQFEIKSQVVVLDLARLQQTTDLHGTLTFLELGHLQLFLAVLGIQLCVVAGKLLELNEEVAERQLEAVDVVGLREQIGNEFLYLDTE